MTRGCMTIFDEELEGICPVCGRPNDRCGCPRCPVCGWHGCPDHEPGKSRRKARITKDDKPVTENANSRTPIYYQAYQLYPIGGYVGEKCLHRHLTENGAQRCATRLSRRAYRRFGGAYTAYYFAQIHIYYRATLSYSGSECSHHHISMNAAQQCANRLTRKARRKWGPFHANYKVEKMYSLHGM
jgi:hypothetical protein